MRSPRQVWKLLAMTETDKTSNTQPFKHTISHLQRIKPDTNASPSHPKRASEVRRLVKLASLDSSRKETERTRVSDVEQHGHEDVVHQVQSDAVSEERVPHHQQVLERKLPAEEQTHPPAAGETPEVAVCTPRSASGACVAAILTCHRSGARSPAG